MINETFDSNRTALVTPQDAIKDTIKDAAKTFPLDTIIMVFSQRLIQNLLEQNEIEPLVPEVLLGDASARHPVHRVKGTSIGLILSGIGGPSAAAMVEELNVLFPLKNLIVFGSCGTLIDLPEGTLIIPENAYRDEGTSYHYVPASDWIRIRNAAKLNELFHTIGIETSIGNTWTTDAFYRETEAKKEQLVKQGCVCVEMECASLQAVCDFHEIAFFPFFYGADSLHSSTWARRILGDRESNASLVSFQAAVKLAELLQKPSDYA